MHILIVDDEPNMLRTLADIFRDEGFDVSTATTGERAVEMSTGHLYDVVLMDVRMPGIDGVEAFRQIREQQPAVPIVMMSAYSVDHLMNDALKEGVVAFLQKPLDAAKVIWMMRTLASRTEAGDPSQG